MNSVQVRFRFDVPGLGSVRFQGLASEELFGRIRLTFSWLKPLLHVPDSLKGDKEIGRKLGYIGSPGENGGLTMALSECSARVIVPDSRQATFARRFCRVTNGDIHEFLRVFLGVSVSDMTDRACLVPDAVRLLSN